MKATASIELLSTDTGGLLEPMPTPCRSLLLHLEEDSGVTIGVLINTAADAPLRPSSRLPRVELTFWDDAAHLYIRPGSDFTLRYPNRIVGSGQVVEVFAF